MKRLRRWLLKWEMEALHLREGDILLVQRMSDPEQQLDALLRAATAANLRHLNIPIVFVDDINGYQVEEITKFLSTNKPSEGQGSVAAD